MDIKNILIIDDDKTNLTTAKNALSELYKAIAVPSGALALKYLENNPCDLILLDINMPEMDGFEVFSIIKSNPKTKEIPVIFLTADINPETENKCLEVGAVDYISKPFVVNVLRSRVNRTLELENLRKNLAAEVEAKAQKIKEMQSSVVMNMATIVARRDNSTGGHIKRTGAVVKLFTEYLYKCGYITDEVFLRRVYRAAPMHDLGKIAVDDVILRKAGKYTDEEYSEMKKHAAEGAKIVEELFRGVEDDAFVDIAINVAKSHHERWDGTGYPNGISKEKIPLEARIMALADVFDALVSERCYKPPFTYEKVFATIKESLGTQFDPELGKLFIECREQLEKLYDDFASEQVATVQNK